MEIHYPIALKYTEGYTVDDLTTLNVDDDWELTEDITVKKGDYPVIQTENELVIEVDLL